MTVKMYLRTIKLTNLKTLKNEDFESWNFNSSMNLATRIILAFTICACMYTKEFFINLKENVRGIFKSMHL